MWLTLILQSSKKIPKSIPNTLEAVLTNNNPNWINVLKVKDPLLPLENTTFQQPPQLTDLLAKVPTKLVANLTLTMNSASSIARTQMPDIFDSMNLEKLNSFLVQY